jgi:hypothetical protein
MAQLVTLLPENSRLLVDVLMSANQVIVDKYAHLVVPHLDAVTALSIADRLTGNAIAEALKENKEALYLYLTREAKSNGQQGLNFAKLLVAQNDTQRLLAFVRDKDDMIDSPESLLKASTAEVDMMLYARLNKHREAIERSEEFPIIIFNAHISRVNFLR